MISQMRKYTDLAGLDAPLRWIVVVILAVTVSAVEAIGALLVYGLLAVATGASGTTELPFIGDPRQLLPNAAEEVVLVGMAMGVGGFFIVRAVIVLGAEYVAARVTENAGARLSTQLTVGYLSMPYAYHLQRNSAELIRNAYATVRELVSDAFRPLVRIVSEGAVVLALIAVLLLSAPLATALVVGVMAPTGYALLRAVYPRLRQLGLQSQEASRATLQSLQQSLSGIRDIKLLDRELFFVQEFRRSRAMLARVLYRRQVFRDIPGVGLETMIVLLIVLLFAAIVVTEGSAAGAIPLLGLFAYAALRLKPSLTVMSRSINALRFSTAGIDDVHRDIMQFRQVRIPANKQADRLSFEREIVLTHVGFRYEGTDRDALQDINLKIPRGSSLGIVGPTGGGKTTLVDVVIGLLRPSSGRVAVDGVDVHAYPKSWQANIGMVPQSIFLVDDTLRRNIALGYEDHLIDDARMQRALDLAQLRSVVDSLPSGLQTVVGERGVRLSGGQRQRVAIARALYREPRVIIFDEGTSALDNVTEALLLEALGTLRDDHTLITVAHRLSTVRSCDTVIVIDGGSMVAVGTFDELLRDSRQFRQMALEPSPGIP
jgi:ATP-binding cassette, subfamily B, bacterial PglK